MRVCQNRLPEQPAKSGSETSCIIDNFYAHVKTQNLPFSKKSPSQKAAYHAPFPIFAKKHICEAKMVANFKNAFLIFRKEIFIYRFF